jgi:hypothetical protein
MSHPELLQLVGAQDRTANEREASGLAVWAAVVKAEPELASEILHLFATDAAAAQWVSGATNETGCSPARHIAEGRSAYVLSKVRSAALGFGA